MTAYRKIFNETRYISFLMEQFDGNPVHDKKIKNKNKHIFP